MREWRRVRSSEESEGAAVRAERARTRTLEATAITPLCEYGHCAHESFTPAYADRWIIFYMAGRECDWSAAALFLPLPSTARPCTSVTIAHQSSRNESPDRLVVQSMTDRVDNGPLSRHHGSAANRSESRDLSAKDDYGRWRPSSIARV